MSERRGWIEVDPQSILSVRHQCNLLGLSRSAYYYKPVAETALNLELMRILDEQYLEAPFLGRDKHTEFLRRKGYGVNHKRVERLLRNLGIRAMGTGRRTTNSNRGHKKYPYLLRNMEIDHCNQVWAADITYIPTAEGYLYLVAIIDWFSRYILSWALSNSLDSDFCVTALEEALDYSTPEIFNTDQGVQFTCSDFVEQLLHRQIRISMDGKGHYWDNIIVERLWRTVKYEEVYLKRYETGADAYEGLDWYLSFYNQKRLHQSLNYRTPAEVYFESNSIEAVN